jgi:hypothetical protein
MSGKTEEYKERIISCIREDIIQDVDGYYYFWPSEGGGYFSEFVLRTIADHLEELNKPWDNEINQYFADLDESDQITENISNE